MSVKVEGYFKSNIGTEDIYNFILQVYDMGAKISVGLTSLFEHNDDLPQESIRIISFSYKGENRDLRIVTNNRITDLSSMKGSLDFNGELYTFINLGKFGVAEEVITTLLGHFGGYIDKDDCDDIGLELVPTNINALVKPIKNMTLNDVYKDYGCLVKISKE